MLRAPFVSALEPAWGMFTSEDRIVIKGDRLGRERDDVHSVRCGGVEWPVVEWISQREIVCSRAPLLGFAELPPAAVSQSFDVVVTTVSGGGAGGVSAIQYAYLRGDSLALQVRRAHCMQDNALSGLHACPWCCR